MSSDGTNAALLSQYGGNTLRVTDLQFAPGVFQSLPVSSGIMVIVGVELPSPVTSPEFYRPGQAAQRTAFRNSIAPAVQSAMTHPNLLMWTVGSRLNTGGNDGNEAVWSFVNDVVSDIKRIDSFHPVGTITANLNFALADALLDNAPLLDFLARAVRTLPPRASHPFSPR